MKRVKLSQCVVLVNMWPWHLDTTYAPRHNHCMRACSYSFSMPSSLVKHRLCWCVYECLDVLTNNHWHSHKHQHSVLVNNVCADVCMNICEQVSHDHVRGERLCCWVSYNNSKFYSSKQLSKCLLLVLGDDDKHDAVIILAFQSLMIINFYGLLSPELLTIPHKHFVHF